MQGQDPRGARLAVRARTTGLTAADVDRALTDRSLLITWLNRGTLHLVRSEDYPWLLALTAPPHFTAIRPAAGAGGRVSRRRGARRRGDRAGARRQGAAHPRRATRPRCRDRSADGGSGAGAHHRAGLAARADRARSDGRPASMGTFWFATGSACRNRSTATWLWPSLPVATSPATAPPATATSPGGRDSLCATRARG